MPPKRGRGQGAKGRGSRAKLPVTRSKPEPDESLEDGTKAAADAEEATSTSQVAVDVAVKANESNVDGKGVNTSGRAECESGDQPDTSVQSVDGAAEDEMELSDAGRANVTSSSSEDVIVVADIPHDVIVIDDDQSEMTKLQEAENARSFWMLRLCPISFPGFVQNKDSFLKIMDKSLSFELRMSQVMHNKDAQRLAGKTGVPNDVPWIPLDRVYSRPRIAGTAALLEMKLIETSVAEVIQIISTCDLKRNDRMRFELTKITREEAVASPFKTEEEIKKEAEEKMNKEKTEEEKKDRLQVNFVKNLHILPEHQRFWLQPTDGSIKTDEDDFIFIKNIPDELPDTILKAIMNTEMVERKMGENNTGSAIFRPPEKMSAQIYMDQYDGILVNSTEVMEMSTKLGTLIEAKKARITMQLKAKEAKKARITMQLKAKGEKRKAEGDILSETHAKRSRKRRGLGRGNQRQSANMSHHNFKQQQGVLGARPSNQFSQNYSKNAGGRWGSAQNRGNMQNDRRGPAQNRGNMQNDRWGPAQNRGNMQNAGGSWGPAQNGDRIQPQIRPSFDTNMDMNQGAPLHMMADLQAKLMEKQRELNFLQNQARLQMTMLEEQKMAIMSRQQQMASSQGDRRDFQQPDRYNWL